MTVDTAEWHLSRGKEQTGPYPLAKVLEAIEKNVLKKTDYVWRHGWPEWRIAGSVPELFDDNAANAPAIPPTPPSGPQPQLPLPPPIALDKPGANYFVRHWRGDLTLPMAFWVNGVVLTTAFQIIAALLAVAIVLALGGSQQTNIYLVIQVLINGIWLGLMIWQYVGIWRSASKHEERGGYGAWGALVKLLIVLAVLAAIVLGIVLVFALVSARLRP